MKITKAHYFHTFPNPTTGQWQKIGLEAELNEIDDYKKCLYDLKRLVTDFYYESNKAAEKQAQEQKKEEPQTQEAKIIAQIYAASDLTVLESFKLLAKNHKSIQAAYEQRLNQLLNAS